LEDDPASRRRQTCWTPDRLRSFEKIARQAPAASFTGELRPYQKYGVDWLHFLHDFRFGGILADDMGLGKTIQVLPSSELLKERRRQAPTAPPCWWCLRA